MYYTIYKITNKIDGKFYIGKHKTQNLNDNYMGSGKLIRRAIKKHGKENFIKEIIHIFETEDEMNKAESKLVVLSEQSYNLCPGGHGGFGYVNSLPNAKERAAKAAVLGGAATKGLKNVSASLRMKKMHAENRIIYSTFAGKKHSAETKKRISESKKLKAIGLQNGEKNSQFGTMWITNGSINKKIRSSSMIPENWYRGRS